jgi:hypothetical protein
LPRFDPAVPPTLPLKPCCKKAEWVQRHAAEKMQEKGWYPAQQAERPKIEQVRQKFSC